MNVKQFVMLLTAQSIISTARWSKNPYKNCGEIPCIYCKDGTAVSVQAHGRAQCTFRGIKKHNRLGHSESFGSELLCCEAPIVNPYDSEDISIVEAYVAEHGGIDIQTTMEKAVKTALFVIAQSLQYEEDDL